MNPYTLAPTPGPGITIPGVGVPGGDQLERDATKAAIDYGWLIAVVLIGAAVIAGGRYVTRRIDFRLVGVLLVVGLITYQVGKGN